MKSFQELREKSVSQAQQKMMGMALAYKRGEMDDVSPEVKKMADSMSTKDLEDFAKTKHKGLPDRKESVELDEAVKTRVYKSGKYWLVDVSSSKIDYTDWGPTGRGFANEKDAQEFAKHMQKSVKESVSEGAMSDFHLMVKEKVPAAKIAKELGLDLKTVKKLMKDMKESVDLEEGKLPPHLAKFFDKKGELKPEVLDRLKKSKKGHEFLMGKDVAPKGYGVKEEVELDEAMRGGNAKTFKTLEDWLMAVLDIKGTTVSKMGNTLRVNGLGRTQSATFELKKGRGSLLEARKDSSADLYFKTYSAAVQHAKSQAEKKGFEVVEDDWFNQVTTGKGKPGRGKTTRHTLKLTKNGKPVRQGLSIQVYNRDTDTNPYELNFYVS